MPARGAHVRNFKAILVVWREDAGSNPLAKHAVFVAHFLIEHVILLLQDLGVGLEGRKGHLEKPSGEKRHSVEGTVRCTGHTPRLPAARAPSRSL